MSIHWPIIKRLAASAARVCITDDRRSYRGLDVLVAASHVAAYLRAKCSSRSVGLLLPTGGTFPIAALGAWMAGKVIVPLNYLLKPEELQYVVDDCETDTVIAVRPLIDHMGFAPKARNTVFLDEDLDFRSVPDLAWPSPAEDEDLAVLLYTSGTSGKPKGVMLTHANISANIRQVIEFAEFTRADSMLGVLPQFHSFGMTALTLLPLAGGLRVVYSARFVPQRIVKLIREHRPTIFIAIPSMYNALLAVKDAGPEDFASLRYTVSGGEPLPEAVAARFFERFKVRINEGYGLTETSPVSNLCLPREYRAHSVGRPMPWIEQVIIDPATGRTLGPGKDGEVRMRGPNIMRGYFKLPNETGVALDAEGFLHTGDMGRHDDDGHLYITGRIKEMLIVGGENVFPREIEEVLNRHPSIAASGVVGAMDPMRGETPVAFVETKEGESFDEKTLIRWCRENLAGYKVPSEVRLLQPLPRNATGKIMRRELKKLIEGGK